MNSVEDYTYRYLETDDLDQYNALLRYVFQVTDQELSSVGWQEKEIIRAKFPTMQKAAHSADKHQDKSMGSFRLIEAECYIRNIADNGNPDQECHQAPVFFDFIFLFQQLFFFDME